MRRAVRFLSLLLLSSALAAACDDEGDGFFGGAGDLRLLVTTAGPDAIELFDARTLERALRSPTGLPAKPSEARSGPGELFVVAFREEAVARGFDGSLFQEEPSSEMGAGERVAYDTDEERIYLAGTELAFFSTRDFSPLGTPPIDLGGRASDVVYDSARKRIFVAVTAGDGPQLRVYSAPDLSEVPGSPIGLPGGAGSRTGDLLLVTERDELLALLPDEALLAGIDPASLQPLPRTPIELRAEAASLARDPERERLYAASGDGRLESVGATDFSLTPGFPQRIADSVADLVFDAGTDRLFVADSAAREVVVLDALTLRDEEDTPLRLDGAPLSVDIIDLRP